MDLPNGMKLELVQVLFRHGARVYCKGESDILKPDDVDQAFIEQYGYEQLTKLGKQQAHNVGCMLRDRYDKFLGNGYHAQEVYAYSSDTDRTKMTLQLVLAGLFPPPNEQRWHPDLDWMPVPFHCAPVEFDILLRANDKPKYKQVLKEIITNTPEILNIYSDAQDFTDLFEKNGVDTSKYGFFMGLTAVHNVFTIHNAEKRKQPDWYSDDIMNKMRYYFERSLDFMSYTRKLQKLFIGALLKRLIENLNVNDEVRNPRKIYLYSGHELNIAAVSRALGIKDFMYPEFSSTIVMEKLRDSQGCLFVRFLGWTGKGDKFIPLRMENCDEICAIENFLNFTKDIIPTEKEIQEMYKDMNVDVQRAFVTDFVYKHKY